MLLRFLVVGTNIFAEQIARLEDKYYQSSQINIWLDTPLTYTFPLPWIILHSLTAPPKRSFLTSHHDLDKTDQLFVIKILADTTLFLIIIIELFHHNDIMFQVIYFLSQITWGPLKKLQVLFTSHKIVIHPIKIQIMKSSSLY